MRDRKCFSLYRPITDNKQRFNDFLQNEAKLKPKDDGDFIKVKV